MTIVKLTNDQINDIRDLAQTRLNILVDARQQYGESICVEWFDKRIGNLSSILNVMVPANSNFYSQTINSTEIR